MTEKYIIGTSPAPTWAAERLAPYKKTDGKTGYEFYGVFITVELNAGDVLIKDRRKINFERQATE